MFARAWFIVLYALLFGVGGVCFAVDVKGDPDPTKLPLAGGTMTGALVTPQVTVNGAAGASVTYGISAGSITVASPSTFAKDVQAHGSTVTFNASNLVLDFSLGPKLIVVATASVTAMSFANMDCTFGAYEISIVQGGAGGWTTVWPAGVIWPQRGAAPTLTVTAGYSDFFPIRCDGRGVHMMPYTLNN